MKEVNSQNHWSFELSRQKSKNFPLCITIGYKQRDRHVPQNLNKDTFCMLPFTGTQCIIGTEKYPDAGKISKYDDDDYNLGFRQIKEAFRA